jgi:hypothetical protein
MMEGGNLTMICYKNFGKFKMYPLATIIKNKKTFLGLGVWLKW